MNIKKLQSLFAEATLRWPEIWFFFLVVVWLGAEISSAFSFFNQLIAFFVVGITVLFGVHITIKHATKINFSFRITLPVVLLSVTLLLTFLQGWFSAPNTSDAMIYHLPRVMFWAQQHSVWQNSINTAHDFMSPLAGYALTTLFLLTKSDRGFFLIQWCSGIASMVIIFRIIAKFRSTHSALWAILVIASTPTFVLEMASTQIDMLTTAMVLMASEYALSLLDGEKLSQSTVYKMFSVIAISSLLAFLNKSIALVWLLPSFGLLVIYWWRSKAKIKNLLYLSTLGIVSAIVAGRWLWQTYWLFGSPLGKHITSSGTELIYWNEKIGFGYFINNIIRNLALHLPIFFLAHPFTLGWETIMKNVFGITASNASTTWYGSFFSFISWPIPQEDIAVNPIIILLGLISVIWAVYYNRKFVSQLRNILFLYVFTWMSFGIFCLIMKWQPYHSRLQLTWLMLLGLSAFILLPRRWPWRATAIVSWLVGIFMIISNVNRPYISYLPFASLIRQQIPVGARIPTPFWQTPRDQQYFHAHIDWYADAQQLLQAAVKTQISQVSLCAENEFSYPFFALSHLYYPSLILHPCQSAVLYPTIVFSTEKPEKALGCHITPNQHYLCFRR